MARGDPVGSRARKVYDLLQALAGMVRYFEFDPYCRESAERQQNPSLGAAQLGSRALYLGHAGEAKTFLSQALNLRQAIGDKAGQAITQHNINTLNGIIAPLKGRRHPAAKSRPLAKVLFATEVTEKKRV